MARQSPATARVVSVLNFFVEHPQQTFTAAQLVKSLQMNRATCHALLAGLVDAGYLYRNPDKSYMIGPGLISLSINAQRNFSPIAIARQQMRILADDLDIVAAALFREGEDVVMRERAASRSHLGWMTGSGLRYSVRQDASPFLALLPEFEAEPELAAMAVPNDFRDEIRRQMQFLRRHGFIAGVHAEDGPSSVRWGIEWGPYARFLDAFSADEAYKLRVLLAPVLNAEGRLAFGLALYGFTSSVSGSEVATIGARLNQAACRLTDFVSGRPARP